jgi:RHH-type proline utilization regulon transcriptional repressor/proline dehydrogenase/delta 1-pyrroline-5-carboxylate dehydrogenase
VNKLSDRLPLAWADETAHIDKLRLSLQDKLDWGMVRQQCEPWVRGIRHRPPPFWALESLLQEFPLSSTEGLALMRLAEALLRVPDQDTAQALIGDQLTQADFASHQEHASNGSAHPWLSGASARVLDLAQQLLPSPDGRHTAPTLVQRLGGPTVVTATARALQLLGRQFVLGQTMDEALAQAKKQSQPDTDQGLLTRHSFDMLGEGARTWLDADRYLASYQHALTQLARQGDKNARQLPFSQRQGLSIKLSALHPRFDPSQHDDLVRELLPRLEQLAEQADRAGVLLTLDAEESFRLELQLDLLARLMPKAGDGLGLAVQAYQHRALAVIDEVHRLATTHDKRLTVRLVKGAYWDTEIKRAQELGLSGYPVYTHKAHTDLSYLACADALLARSDVLYPQFATHNAATIAAVMQLARQHKVDAERYEWQRLHGMGEGVYRELRRAKAPAPLRIYAPVGEHRDLLAYLVRRLLENGANASFVHQLADPQVSLDELLASPWVASATALEAPAVPAPVQLYGPDRRNAIGRDLNCQMHRDALEAAIQVRLAQEATPCATRDLSAAEAQAMMDALAQGWQDWEETPATTRCAVLDKVANRLEAEFDSWAADLVVEARKTMSDAVAEVRETIDLARYYAQQGRHHLQTQSLPGPTGESNEWQLRGRGVFVCIAPWNFPLAIFGGQVMAALAAGNAVAAKPAEQTPQIARRFVALLHHCGVPANAVDCACGPGASVGAALVASKHCAGVAFTGSVATGKRIQRMLAQGDRPIVPLIAETGGLNAMVVDSTALPEQVIDAVVASAFLSAGQRCSALRLLCLHSATADALEAMLAGALQTLVTGPSSDWSTDVGPVIDRHAHELLCAHLAELDHQSQQPRSGVRLIGSTPATPSSAAHIIAPTAYTLPRVSTLTAEHFGPILHVVRWGPGTTAPDIDTLIDQINATGYGLTLGVQTRIDSRAQHIARRSRVGNVYVNRGMTGAVVGSQPFGGQGWSGTGPKAGGPHYLLRFCTEQVVSINTAAAGGNAALLTRGH